MKNSMDKVYNSTLKFLAPLSLESTYKEIAKEVISLLDGTDASIFMSEKSKLKRVYSTSTKLSNINLRKNGYTYSVFKNQKPIILNFSEIYKIHPEIGETETKFDMMAPLVNANSSIGVISVHTKKRRFTKSDQEILNFITPFASLAIKKAQLHHEVESALKTRDLFISMASHELKTPITTMYIYTQLLKNKAIKGESFDVEWINNLLYEMARLTKLVDELLQLSQIKTGNFKYNFEELNIIEVIEKALTLFKVSHQSSRVQFKNQTKLKKITLVGDPDKLIQVIINLLDNASKHNAWKKPIIVTLSELKKKVKITVEDHGTGIKKAEITHIFDEFYKGKSHTKSGMGLGLYLIKKIITRHHGRITINSIENHGTNVSILFPELK